MTTIIWDGVVMCADKKADDGVSRTVTKIERIRGSLVGFAGHMGHCLKLKYWWASGAEPDRYPVSPTGSDEYGRLLVVDGQATSPKVWIYEGPYPFRVEDDCCAVGSGREMATALVRYMLNLQDLGVLHNPQKLHIAELAMGIVSVLDNGTGMGYDTLPL